MAFKIADETYLWPVVINIPRDGKFVTSKFKARFKMLSQSRINDIIESAGSDGDDDLVEEVLTGWEQFADADSAAIEYDDENRAQAIDTPFIRVGLVKAFMESITGKQNRRKN